MCPACRAMNPTDSQFCESCGTSLVTSREFRCPSCGSASRHDSQFCANCGVQLDTNRRFIAVASSQPVPSHLAQIRPPTVTAGAIRLLMTRGWPEAVGVVLIAALISVVVMGLIILVAALAATIASSPVSIIQLGSDSDLSSGLSSVGLQLLLGPLVLWVGAHGGLGSEVITLTGLTWICLGLFVAQRVVRRTRSDRPRGVVARGLKIALLYAALVLGATLLLSALRVEGLNLGSGNAGALGASISFDPILAAIVAGFAGLVASIGSSGLRPVLHLAGICGGNQTAGAGLISGAARTAITSALFYLGVFLIAAIVELVNVATGLGDVSSGLGRSFLGSFIGLVAGAVLYGGLDIGLGGFVVGMRFFADSSSAFIEPTAWVYLTVVAVPVAALRGGFFAARNAEATHKGRAILIGAATGPLVSVMLFFWSLIHLSSFGGGFVLSSLGLPLVWCSSFGAIGGLVLANRSGLPASASDLSRSREVVPRARSVPESSAFRTPAPPPLTSKAAPGTRKTSSKSSISSPPARTHSADVGSGRPTTAHMSEGSLLGPNVSAEMPRDDVLESNMPPENCPGCGQPNPLNSEFCGFCGQELSTLMNVCERCGSLQPSNIFFCRNCGARIDG